MPIYVYEFIREDGQPGEQFELVQSIKDPPLTQHPETGEPIQRVIQAPYIGGKWSDGAMHRSVSDNKKLDRLGFTKYVRAGDGVFEKRAGKGPDVISRDRPIRPDEI
jgi:hypothetical protein